MFSLGFQSLQSLNIRKLYNNIRKLFLCYLQRLEGSHFKKCPLKWFTPYDYRWRHTNHPSNERYISFISFSLLNDLMQYNISDALQKSKCVNTLCYLSLFHFLFCTWKNYSYLFIVHFVLWLWFCMYLKKVTSASRLSYWCRHTDPRDLFKQKESGFYPCWC